MMRLLVLTILVIPIFSPAQDVTTATQATPWKVYQDWPFSAAEAKRRQEETAKALGVAVEKEIAL